jgi:hypothetical protein
LQKHPRLCSEKPEALFTRLGALQKTIPLLKAMAISCAMLIGDARVSTNDQDNAAQVAHISPEKQHNHHAALIYLSSLSY